MLLRDIPNIPPTLNRDLPVEGKNDDEQKKEYRALKKEAQQQNIVWKKKCSWRPRYSLEVKFLSQTLLDEPASKADGLLSDRPWLGGGAYLGEWRALKVLQVL